MKPEKASLHGTKCRFIRRSRASCTAGALHIPAFSDEALFRYAPQYEALFRYAPQYEALSRYAPQYEALFRYAPQYEAFAPLI